MIPRMGITVDVEIKTPIDECGGWEATDQMGLACVAVKDRATGRMSLYTEDQTEELRERIRAASLVVGYNTWGFDYPVIWGIKKAARFADLEQQVLVPEFHHLAGTCIDLLRCVWRSVGLDPNRFDYRTHGGFGLDAVAKATLGRAAQGGKTGNGADAPKWWRDGRIGRCSSYCMDDVYLTDDLATFIADHGYFVSPKSGRVVECRLEPVIG